MGCLIVRPFLYSLCVSGYLRECYVLAPRSRSFLLCAVNAAAALAACSNGLRLIETPADLVDLPPFCTAVCLAVEARMLLRQLMRLSDAFQAVVNNPSRP